MRSLQRNHSRLAAVFPILSALLLPLAPARAADGETPQEIVNYSSMLAVHASRTPALLENPDVANCWARLRLPLTWTLASSDEFFRNELQQWAKTDLKQAADTASRRRFTFYFTSSFGEYDFGGENFPLPQQGTSVLFTGTCPLPSAVLPPSYHIQVPDLALLSPVPIAAADARAYADRHPGTNGRGMDRRVAFTITADLDDGDGSSATIIEATAYSYPDLEAGRGTDNSTIYHYTPEIIQGRREMASLRLAEQRRAALHEWKAQAVATMAQQSREVRMRNWVSSVALDTTLSLDNVREARGASIQQGNPVTTTLLVQSAGDGRNSVQTLWPGHLSVTVPENLPALEKSGWYLVEGALEVDRCDGLCPAQMKASSIYACTSNLCDETTDITALVERKLALGLVN